MNGQFRRVSLYRGMGTVIDVVTTGIRRPEILVLAYESYFAGAIQGLPKLRIILNIDPIGDGSAETMRDIAGRYAHELVTREAETPNFSAAVNWAWSHVRSDLFLHLEDDWLLRHPISFAHWQSQLLCDPVVKQSVLVRKRPRVGTSCYSFRPHLAKSQVIEEVGPIPHDVNPEKYSAQILGNRASMDYGPAYQYHDMGRKWAKAQRLRKSEAVSGLNMSSQSAWFASRPVSWLGCVDYRLSKIRWSLTRLATKIRVALA